MGLTTGFRNSDGKDIGSDLVEKSYLIDRYPELANTFRFAGLWIWGRNNYGQLGNNTVTHRSSPVQTVSGGTNWKLVASSIYYSAAIKTDGTLWSWGLNSNGELGNNTATGTSSPVQTISAGTNWKLLSLGRYFTAAIKTDGTLWTWGQNTFGQLGYSSITSRSSPGQTISGGTNWKQVSGGSNHMAAVKTDGTLWTWGRGDGGELGTNAVAHRSSPGQTIAGGTNWRSVATGQMAGPWSAAIKTDGTLWLWGNNSYGQLGDNTTTPKSSPVQTIASGTNWKQVSLGEVNAAAIKTDGTLWTWGSNGRGTLGNNTITGTSSPVQTVSAGTNWKQLSSGRYHIAAIKTDGTLWAWGVNTNGVLGDGSSITHRSSPIQTVSGGTNWKLVAGGWYNTIAIRDDSSDLFGDPM